jgi:hypothetical protein
MSSAGDAAHLRYLAVKLYVSSLPPVERSKLAASYLLKVPPRHRAQLLRSLSVFQLAVNQVFSRRVRGY